ncbi:MAG: serine hydrolase [Gammaproteobacteria bacterium]|nr:serine hydrolase [Gammaproteobacteria bacterium]
MIAIFCLSTTVFPLAPARADDIRAKLLAYMDSSAGARNFSGSVMVTKGDEVLLSKGYGFANVEHEISNTPATKFRLGSITKQFTAMAVLILEERKKLRVEDPISEHLEDTPETWKDVTIHHLLTHTSGIHSFTNDKAYRENMMLPQSIDEMIARFRDEPLEFEPGSRFKYCNSGYFLLGAIIERASGESYEAFLKAAIFTPLGMKDSGYDHPRTILPRRASGYQREGGELINAPYLDMSQPYAAGALYSTVKDLVRWDQKLRAGELISEESHKKMFTPFKNGYAYGWNIRERFGHKQVGHGGGINGFNTSIARFPDQGVCSVVLSNMIPGPAGQIAGDLAAIALGERVKPLRPPENPR